MDVLTFSVKIGFFIFSWFDGESRIFAFLYFFSNGLIFGSPHDIISGGEFETFLTDADDSPAKKTKLKEFI